MSAFKRLDLFQLQRYGNRWANKFSVIQIESIILYRHYSESAEVFGVKSKALFDVKTESTKYALVFEISGCTHINLMEIDLGTMPTDDDDECLKALKEIVFANLLIPHPLFDPSFADEVYDDEPSIDYFRNWTFRLKRPGDSLEPNIRTDEPFWVLYDADVRPIRSPKVIELLKKVRPEIESLYAEIKKVGFTSQVIDDKEWKKAALNQFDNNKFEYIYIKREYLEDKQIYFFSGGQERRDFIGKVLQKIIQKNGLGTFGYQLLYNTYKSIIE